MPKYIFFSNPIELPEILVTFDLKILEKTENIAHLTKQLYLHFLR